MLRCTHDWPPSVIINSGQHEGRSDKSSWHHKQRPADLQHQSSAAVGSMQWLHLSPGAHGGHDVPPSAARSNRATTIHIECSSTFDIPCTMSLISRAPCNPFLQKRQLKCSAANACAVNTIGATPPPRVARTGLGITPSVCPHKPQCQLQHTPPRQGSYAPFSLRHCGQERPIVPRVRPVALCAHAVLSSSPLEAG